MFRDHLPYSIIVIWYSFMITLLGLICTSLHEVLAREPCLQCMDRNQRAVCLTHDSWNPTDAFSPGKRYDCFFHGVDVQCVTRNQDSRAVCNSAKKCGFELNMFTEGTKCFIDMHDGISAPTTIFPGGDREGQVGVVTDVTREKCTGAWYGLFIGMGIATGICLLVHFIMFRKGHIEWKSKKGKKKINENTNQPSTDEQTATPLK